MAEPSGCIHVINKGEGVSDYYLVESQQNHDDETRREETLLEALLSEQNVQLRIMFEDIA